MGNVTFRIEGRYRRQWVGIFVGLTHQDAKEKLHMLQERNPACRYRLRWQAHGEAVEERFIDRDAIYSALADD